MATKANPKVGYQHYKGEADSLSPSEEEVKVLESKLINILGKEPEPFEDEWSYIYINNKREPVTFNRYLRRLIARTRYNLYLLKSYPKKSEVIEALNEIYRASELLHKRLAGKFSLMPDEVINSNAEHCLFMSGFCDATRLNFADECLSLCDAIDKAKEYAEKENSRKGRAPDLDIRVDCATDFAIYLKTIGISPKKTSEGFFDLCIKEIFSFCRYEYKGEILVLPYREDNKKILLNSIENAKDENRICSLCFDPLFSDDI